MSVSVRYRPSGVRMNYLDLPISIDRMIGRIEFTYGPTALPQLKITALDTEGDPVLLIFGADAIRQLASLLKDIKESFPAAVSGH